MSSSSHTTLRGPSEAYRGRNGFCESHEPADKDHPGDITLRNVRYAQWMLEQKGVPLPSKEALRELGTKKPLPPDTLDYVDEKIKQLKRQHARDLESLHTFQAGEFRQRMLDHRRCMDDSAYMDIDESYPDQVEFREALRQLDQRMRDDPDTRLALEDALSTLRYTYLKALLPLIRRRRNLRDRETKLRKQRDASFPLSIEEYHHITERDVKLRVARFLTADSTEQERMMDKFGWAYRQVDPLRTAYKSSAEFKTEIQGALKDIQASDPRKRVHKQSTYDPGLPYVTFSPLS
ncbi:hypothetical protein EDC04DRAFT_2564759 [Pisolithus marmoratus]|nr:hypothetical protein EDC04DRAFT_2564759 [Pisolithus marmoratus]